MPARESDKRSTIAPQSQEENSSQVTDANASPTVASAPIVDPKFEKKLNKYIERAEKEIDKLTERQALSGQEFDKQIVALAGGGLALSITLVKDFLDNKTELLWLLFASWALLLTALTVNLISHRISTAHYDLMITRQKYYLDCAEDEDKEFEEEKDANWKKSIDHRTKWVNGLNLGALITCLLGITLFVIFTFYNKYYTDAGTGTTSHTAATRMAARPNQRSLGNNSTTYPTSPSSSVNYDTTPRATRGKVDRSSFLMSKKKVPTDSSLKPHNGQYSLVPTNKITNPSRPPKPEAVDTDKK